jgi:hypothetical protein
MNRNISVLAVLFVSFHGFGQGILRVQNNGTTVRTMANYTKLNLAAGCTSKYSKGSFAINCTGGGVALGTANQIPIINSRATAYARQSKAVIDPRDYGVDCTDTTDSTTAWAAAVTAAGNYGKIVVPEGCLFRLSGTTGWTLYKVYGLEIEFSGRQGNGCDNQGPNPAGIDYRQAYASGNKVVSIVDSQRLLIKNLTIYTNGGADTGINIDQDGSTPPITTRDDFYNVCIDNNTVTRNSSWNGFRVSYTSTSNVENIHFYHPDVTCSQSSATSTTSNGNAILFGSSANLKNEIVDDIRATNCSQDIQDDYGSDLTWQFGLASSSYLNFMMGGFNDALYGFRTENAHFPVQIGNSIGPHLIEHNDFAALAGPSPIDCPSGCGQTTVINNETDSAPTNWFNVHSNPGASGPLFAAGNRYFTWTPLDWGLGAFVIGTAGTPVTSTFPSLLLTPSLASGSAIGGNAQSPAIDLQSLYGNSATKDDYIIQSLPTGVNGTITSSTLELGHANSSTVAPWLAFGGQISGATFAAMPVPVTPTIIPRGATGATSYTYEVVAHGGTGVVPSSTFTTTTGNASLTSSNYNQLLIRMTAGCTYFDVYRTASGGTPSSAGKIGTVDCFTTQPVGVANASALLFTDTGLAGDSSSPPVSNTTGQIVSTVPTGNAPLSITSTTPVANLTVSNHPQVYEAGVLTTAEQIYTNTQALTAGAATHTFAASFTFTSSSTFQCQCTDQTAAAACKAVPASATTVTLAGTGTDVIALSCSGH